MDAYFIIVYAFYNIQTTDKTINVYNDIINILMSIDIKSFILY